MNYFIQYVLRLLFLVITLISFSQSITDPLKNGQAVVTCSGDGLSEHAVIGIKDIRNPEQNAVKGRNWDASEAMHSQWKFGHLGELFGITLDDEGNIYATRTSIYDTRKSAPENGLFKGLFGPNEASNGGEIYKMDMSLSGSDRGKPTLFARLPNSGGEEPDALGNICYDKVSNQFFVTNFYDGCIYRLSYDGIIIDKFNPFDGTVYINNGQELNNPINSLPNGIPVPLEKRVWGVEIFKGILYYGIWNRPSSYWVKNAHSLSPSEFPNDVRKNTIGSIELNQLDGFDLNNYNNSLIVLMNSLAPVSDITFTDDGRMFLAEKTMVGSSITNNSENSAHRSKVYIYTNVNNNNWIAQDEYFPIGHSSNGRNSSGGVAYEKSNNYLWAMGDMIKNNVWDATLCGEDEFIYGLVGIKSQGVPVSPSDRHFCNGIDGSETYSIWDYQYMIDVDRVTLDGTNDKRDNGDIEIFSNCNTTAFYDFEVKDQTSACDVKFTFKSSVPTTDFTFVWDFGDGTSESSNLDPTHYYASSGTYQVKLTVVSNENDLECSSFVTNTVDVGECTACPTEDDSKRGNIWYFGTEGSGLDFNNLDADNNPTPIGLVGASKLNTFEGCATLSDTEGKVLLYTDGENIWDKNHALIFSGLSGDPSSTQSGIIVPNPANNNEYFVFGVGFRNQNVPVSYCTVKISDDIASVGGGISELSDVIVKEKITVVKHTNRNAYWIIVPEFNSQFFYSYLLNERGEFEVVQKSDVGVVFERNGGQLVASPNGKHIASGSFGPGLGVEIFDFDNETGKLTNRVLVKRGGSDEFWPYGVCFSPNSNFLYVGYTRKVNVLTQYDLSKITGNEILASGIDLDEFPEDDGIARAYAFGSIQIGPNNKLYITTRSRGAKVAYINSPNKRGVDCGYVTFDDGLNVPGSDLGLPNIVPSFLVPANEIQFTCNAGEKRINFRLVDNQGNVLNDGSEISWDFGDGSTAVLGASVSHTYASTNQDYNIIVTITKGGCPKEVKAVASFTDCCGEVNIRDAELVHCFGKEKTFRAVHDLEKDYSSFIWNVGEGDEVTTTTSEYKHTYSSTGFYDLSLTAIGKNGCGDITIPAQVEVEDCINCEECIPSFSPIPGEKYQVSAWVKENVKDVASYPNPAIELAFRGSATVFMATPSGAIIDGWQRIEYIFEVPSDATDIKIRLQNLGTAEVYFDDIRIHPFNSNMKTYVYDPFTLRLQAEIDENNYSTFYEYDEEGALVRVKKETQRGVKTIQETRNNISKQR